MLKGFHMRWIALLMFIAFGSVVAQADDVIINARRVNISTAQQDAELMARSGVLRHCGTAGGRREGIGMSSAGPDAALKSCCYYGRYRIVEKGVAWSPVKRAWFAVIRYE
jgi:hypothetical protein